jgi:hypothetical protein
MIMWVRFGKFGRYPENAIAIIVIVVIAKFKTDDEKITIEQVIPNASPVTLTTAWPLFFLKERNAINK